MANNNWLSLFEYSGKYNVSISTLRRRIKHGEIKFRLDQGKYFLLDGETLKDSDIQVQLSRVEEQPVPKQVATTPARPTEIPFSSANELLIELKKAYTAILQEKDEQIRTLREEISDLKTLVRVLEDALPKN